MIDRQEQEIARLKEALRKVSGTLKYIIKQAEPSHTCYNVIAQTSAEKAEKALKIIEQSQQPTKENHETS